MNKLNFVAGDIASLKKKHPCGSFQWEITRVGMDIGIKCQGCGHYVMVPRPKFEKMVKTIVTNNNADK